jgi:hypothetical protein
MSAATPRTISNAPDLRQLLAAVGALILAVALLVAVTISRQSSFQASSAPAAVPASVAHDHGWSVGSGSQDLVVSTGNGVLVYTGTPYAAPDSVGTGIVLAPAVGEFRLAPGNQQPVGVISLPASRGLVVATQNGGILYTGIPYPAPETGGQGGSNGTRFPQ